MKTLTHHLIHMKFKPFKLLLFFSCAATVFAQERTNEELADIARNAFEKRSEVQFDGKLAIKTFRSELASLNDAEKIRAFYQILIDKENSPKIKMSRFVFRGVTYPIGQDPDLISDYSELRRLLKIEQNPRRFYFLGCMKPYSTKQKRYDFIPETAHMLFKDGPVLKDEGEYTQPYSSDVSLFAYSQIVRSLEIHGYKFQPPADLTHDQEVAELARWLKNNWKGCENLEIPEKFLKIIKEENESTEKDTLRQAMTKEKHSDTAQSPNNQTKKERKSPLPKKIKQNCNVHESDTQKKKGFSIWLLAISIIVAVLSLVIFLKRKSAN